MKKYFVIAKNNLHEYFVYRLNFILWRFRIVVSIVIGYFLWSSIYSTNIEIFNYRRELVLTYMILVSLINAVVFSTKTFQISEEIRSGKLSVLLLKPINFFYYYSSRDISDKFVNTLFAFCEIALFLLFLQPPFIWQANAGYLVSFLLLLMLGAVLYFEINVILAFVGFWSKETWAPRFLFFIIVTFLSGMYFPLDIMPKIIYEALMLTPFPYLLFVPLRVYLGKISPDFIIRGIVFSAIWIIILNFLMKKVFRSGLKIYTSEGI